MTRRAAGSSLWIYKFGKWTLRIPQWDPSTMWMDPILKRVFVSSNMVEYIVKRYASWILQTFIVCSGIVDRCAQISKSYAVLSSHTLDPLDFRLTVSYMGTRHCTWFLASGAMRSPVLSRRFWSCYVITWNIVKNGQQDKRLSMVQRLKRFGIIFRLHKIEALSPSFSTEL